MKRFEIDVFTEKTFNTHKFPEMSYEYDNVKDALGCIDGLLNNKNSGIYKCEITLNDFYTGKNFNARTTAKKGAD